MEVVLPAGALDLSKATTATGTAPQGTLTVKLSQVRGHFSAATTDLGSFQIQVTDGQGEYIARDWFARTYYPDLPLSHERTILSWPGPWEALSRLV